MLVSYNSYQSNLYQNKFSFQAKVPSFTEEFFLEVVNSTLPVKQKAKKLGISLDTYYKKLRERGISYKKLKTIPSDVAQQLKTEIQEYLNKGIKIPEICKIKGFTESKYYKIAEELGIVNPKQAVIEKTRAISKERFQEVASSLSTVEEKCKELGIKKDSYYKLLKKYPILTERKKILAHNSSITKERFIEIATSDMPYIEKLKILGMSVDSYNSRLAKYNIVTDYMKAKQNISSVTKEKLESLINSGMKVSAICDYLHIDHRTYTRLLDKFHIVTLRKASKQNIDSINGKLLQTLIDQGFPKEYICKFLNINDAMFYKLLKRHNIIYDYLHHANEIYIPKSHLDFLASSGLPVRKIAENLGIAQATYSEKAKVAKVKTPLRESIDRIKGAPAETIMRDRYEGKKIEEICEEYNITPSNYKAIREKTNFWAPKVKLPEDNIISSSAGAS